MTSNETEMRSQMFLPPLQYAILTQGLNEDTHTVNEMLCRDDPKWISDTGEDCLKYSVEGADCSEKGTGGKTARESCLVACNNCPSHITLQKSAGHMYNRLPSPIKDGKEPDYSSLIDDKEWKMGLSNDTGRDQELNNKLDDIEEKLDELRRNTPQPSCTCTDVDNNIFPPSRCSGASLSDNFIWGDEYNILPEGTKDSDTRYKVLCRNGFDYKQRVPSLKGKTLVYNCTDQKWETTDENKRGDGFHEFVFDTMIHCSEVTNPDLKPHACVKEGGVSKCVQRDGLSSYKDKAQCEHVCSSTHDCGPEPYVASECNDCYDVHNGYRYRNGECICKDGKPYSYYGGLGYITCPNQSFSNMAESGTAVVESFTNGGHSPSPKMCSENIFKQIFYDRKNCISPSPNPTTAKVSLTEMVVVFILSVLSIVFGFIIYNAGGNIPLYVAIVISMAALYILIRFNM
jgi:hypothetical protein